jgi:hypothetical protein
MNMSSCLHITNGDAAANTLKQFLADDDVLPWRDPMTDGPFPVGLSLSATSEVRAGYLAGPEIAYDQAVRDFRLRDEHLAASARYDEITLWFEHDLLDQLQILQLLDWFADAQMSGTKLRIICVDAFPGVVPFRGLGQLDAAQMATLVDKRLPVTPAQFRLAQAGWAAFRSPDPRDIETYLKRDLQPLPFMKAALSRHLQDFPAVSNGLGRTDRQVLQLVFDGVSLPGQIFAANMELESVLFIGDWGIYRRLQDLCNGKQPLLNCRPYRKFRGPLDASLSTEDFRRQEFSLTEYGHRVLANEADASGEVDRWLGGVHLTKGKPRWRWDESAQHLTVAGA